MSEDPAEDARSRGRRRRVQPRRRRRRRWRSSPTDVECHVAAGPDERGHLPRPRRLPGDDRRWERGVGDRSTPRSSSTEDLESDHLLVEIDQRAVGAGSGVPVQMTIFWLFRVRRRERSRVSISYGDREAGGRRGPRLDLAPMAVKTEAIGKTYDAGHLHGRAREDPRVRERDRCREPGSPRSPTPPRRRAIATSSRRRCSASSTRSRAIAPGVLDPEVGINFATMVHGGQEFEWGEPVCAGDEITTVREGARDLREGRQGLLRLRVALQQPGRRRGRARDLDQHRQGCLR